MLSELQKYTYRYIHKYMYVNIIPGMYLFAVITRYTDSLN